MFWFNAAYLYPVHEPAHAGRGRIINGEDTKQAVGMENTKPGMKTWMYSYLC